MNRALFDSNILIDALKGHVPAKKVLKQFDELFISRITWMEVMIGANDDESEFIESFLRNFEVIELDSEIARAAITLRKTLKMKLPDAIILASAHCQSVVLVTRNTKDFTAKTPGVLVPYNL